MQPVLRTDMKYSMGKKADPISAALLLCIFKIKGRADIRAPSLFDITYAISVQGKSI